MSNGIHDVLELSKKAVNLNAAFNKATLKNFDVLLALGLQESDARNKTTLRLSEELKKTESIMAIINIANASIEMVNRYV